MARPPPRGPSPCRPSCRMRALRRARPPGQSRRRAPRRPAGRRLRKATRGFQAGGSTAHTRPRSRRRVPRSSPLWPSEPRPKGRRCRAEGCRRSPWRKWLAAGLRRRPFPTTVSPRAATPSPRGASGLPRRRSPRPPVVSGRKRVRNRTPRKSLRVGGSSGLRARPEASHAPGRLFQRGAAPSGAAALNSSRSYVQPTGELGTPRIADPPQGSPRAAAAVALRTAAGEPAPGGREVPAPDDAVRAPAGIVAAAAIVAATAVAAIAMGAGRAAPSFAGPATAVTRAPCRRAGGSPDPTARRRRAARGRRAFRIRGRRRAGTRTTAVGRASGIRWQGKNWLRSSFHPGGEGKSQSKGGGRRGKGSKARLRQQARHAQPQTEKQQQYRGRRDDRAVQRLSTSLRNIEERRRGGPGRWQLRPVQRSPRRSRRVELRAGQAVFLTQDPQGGRMVPVSCPAWLRTAHFFPAPVPEFSLGETSPLCIGPQFFAGF